MAMLAEPRRKQKLSVDPRNRQWSDDQSKFGQKMLEKMGWKNGKGLGANEDGKTDHIRVSLKNNTLGVGCSQSYDDNWIAHQDDFNDILANLKQDHGAEDDKEDVDDEEDASSKSLEERSKKTKSRVHYQKFTRGKDLSKYGATDLDCILGKRGNKSASSTPQTQSVNNSDTEDAETTDSSHGFTTVTQNTNIQDYFAKKMAELKKGRKTPQLQTSENEVDNKESIIESNGDQSDHVEIKDKKKKRKRNRKKTTTDNNNDCDTPKSDEEVIEKLSESNNRKKRNQSDDSLDEESIEQFDRTSDDAQEASPRKKKCKGKRRENDSEAVLENDCNEQINSSESSSKKNKKKRKNKGIN